MSKRHGGNAPRHNGEQTIETEHRLVLIDRAREDGSRHRHPWQATCVCGWVAVATRRRSDSEARYRQHRNGVENMLKANHRHRDDDGDRTHRLTPIDQLPEALR